VNAGNHNGENQLSTTRNSTVVPRNIADNIVTSRDNEFPNLAPGIAAETIICSIPEIEIPDRDEVSQGDRTTQVTSTDDRHSLEQQA
jgi:hypothetical protein